MLRQGAGAGLPVRIMLLLTLALLPLGYLGVIQTTALSDTAESRLRLSLIGATEATIQGKTQRLERGLGAAEAIAGIVGQFIDDPDGCAQFMATFTARDPAFSYAGFLERDGAVRCASAPEFLSYMADADLTSLTGTPRAVIRPAPNAPADGAPVSVILWPVVEDDGSLRGYVALTLPGGEIAQELSQVPARPTTLATYNREGRALRLEGPEPTAAMIAELQERVGQMPPLQPTTHLINDDTGAPKVLVLLPMIPQQVYAIAVWPHTTPSPALFGMSLPAPFFPGLMWIASLAVAYLAMHRLVVRHVQRLGQQMEAFGRHRTINRPDDDPAIPSEIRALETTFQGMALDLISEEARMEDALREKNMLIKEVHHRVKNNLQLITSIMNLQVRDTQSVEAQNILARLQDRVRGLATVYGHMYEARGVERTSAAELLGDVFGAVLNAGDLPAKGVTVTVNFEDASLTADQAVPLTLLASELAAQCLATVLASPDQTHDIDAEFALVAHGQARLACTHRGPQRSPESATPEAGLASKLLTAFARQLDTTPKIDAQSDYCRTSITFALQAFDYADRSY